MAGSTAVSQRAAASSVLIVTNLLAFGFIYFAGYFYTAEAPYVFRHALVKGFGDPLPVGWSAQAAFVSGIANERYLSQDGRHVRADQDNKWGLLNSPIADAWVFPG